jgi:transposase
LEKRGLTAHLQQADMSESQGIYWSDEMRVGLIGQVRRVWASRGVKVVQKVEYKYDYSYLNLAVNGLSGELLWRWSENMQSTSIAAVVKDWAAHKVQCLIWDRARGHRGPAYADIDIKRIEQPPYSPELNPAERVFQYLRDKIEGIIYGSLDNKRAAVERELSALAHQPDRVKSLAGWQWIRDSLAALA